MKEIKKTVYFDASAHDVYEALIDEKKHAAFTGAGAKIENKVGGKFSVWDDYATGINKELVPDKLIVQSWRASDWPEGMESVARFEMSEEDGKTKLVFTQTGIPEEKFDDITQGWEDFYWKPMKEYLDKEEK